jgi:hypothetical protein
MVSFYMKETKMENKKKERKKKINTGNIKKRVFSDLGENKLRH